MWYSGLALAGVLALAAGFGMSSFLFGGDEDPTDDTAEAATGPDSIGTQADDAADEDTEADGGTGAESEDAAADLTVEPGPDDDPETAPASDADDGDREDEPAGEDPEPGSEDDAGTDADPTEAEGADSDDPVGEKSGDSGSADPTTSTDSTNAGFTDLDVQDAVLVTGSPDGNFEILAVRDVESRGCGGAPHYRLVRVPLGVRDAAVAVDAFPESGQRTFLSPPAYREGPQIVASLIDYCENIPAVYNVVVAPDGSLSQLREVLPIGYDGDILDASWDLVDKVMVIDFVKAEGDRVELRVNGDTSEVISETPYSERGICLSDDIDQTFAPDPALNAAANITRQAIFDAASTCDYEALTALTAPDFTASFGGDTAREVFESGGPDYMAILVTLLQLDAGELAVEDGGAYVWPTAASKPPDALDASDVADLVTLGVSQEEIDALPTSELGYAGYRTSIDNEGNWIFFVAGD